MVTVKTLSTELIMPREHAEALIETLKIVGIKYTVTALPEPCEGISRFLV